MGRWREVGLAAAAAVAFLVGGVSPVLADGGISDGASVLGPGVPYPFVMCDQTVRMTAAGSSAVLISHVAGKTTYICGYAFGLGTVASTSAILVWGTGSTCGSSQVSSSPLVVNGTTPVVSTQFASPGGAIGAFDQSPVSGTSDFCLVVSGSASVNGIVRYAVF